jgi:ribosomal protein S18 acetylase RimI-like enzyme
MAAQLPDGFAFRPPVDSDGEPILEMMNEESIALRGVAMASLDWIMNAWTAPGVDRENDFAVITGPDGEVAGYVFVESHPPYTEVFSVGAVAVRHHGRGIGAAIVEELERRACRFLPFAPPGERVVIHAGTMAEEPRVAELLTAHGYFEARRFARMSIEFEGRPAAPAALDGIDLRPFATGDEHDVYDCLTEAFADHWGGNWPTEESWLHDQFDGRSEVDPGFWHLAWHGAELAGVLIAAPEWNEADLGHVSEVGVRRAHRRRGIGEALLRTSFVQFHRRGCRGVVLEVDTESITGATRLYERLGMTAEPRFSQWEKELRPAAGV